MNIKTVTMRTANLIFSKNPEAIALVNSVMGQFGKTMMEKITHPIVRESFQEMLEVVSSGKFIEMIDYLNQHVPEEKLMELMEKAMPKYSEEQIADMSALFAPLADDISDEEFLTHLKNYYATSNWLELGVAQATKDMEQYIQMLPAA